MVSLLTGQADLANIEADMAQILSEKGLVVIKDEWGWNRKLMINHRKPAFDDKRMRQAIAHAIDRRELIDKGHKGFGSPASYGLLSMDHDMNNPNTPTYPFDPDRARRLLESVGFQRGSDGFYEKDGRPLQVELISSAISAGGRINGRPGWRNHQKVFGAGRHQGGSCAPRAVHNRQPHQELGFRLGGFGPRGNQWRPQDLE